RRPLGNHLEPGSPAPVRRRRRPRRPRGRQCAHRRPVGAARGHRAGPGLGRQAARGARAGASHGVGAAGPGGRGRRRGPGSAGGGHPRTRPGRVRSPPVWLRSVSLIRAGRPACPEAVAAVREADWVVLGPGSWFTSVLPHLLVPELAEALIATPARRLVALNLVPQPGETDGFSPHT